MSEQHTVKAFDSEIQAVQQGILTMGEKAVSALRTAIDAFQERNPTHARQTMLADQQINQKFTEIENRALRLLALRQPMAIDLRVIVASLHCTNELERIGDYAKDIAQHVITLTALPTTGLEQRFVDLGQQTVDLLQAILASFSQMDAARARQLRQQDAHIDRAYTSVLHELLLLNHQNAQQASTCLHLAFIGRCLERVGDHATNLAENIVFIVEGQPPAETREKADGSADLVV